MSTFDLAVGVGQNGLNRLLAQIFGSMSAFLSGSWNGSFEGASYSASWNLTSAPTIDLSAPQGPNEATFYLTLPTNVTIGGGTSATVPVTFRVTCAASVTGGTVTFAVGVVDVVSIGDPNPVVRAIVNTFLLRAVQLVVYGFVTTIGIPSLSVAGVGFSPPTVAIVTPAGGTPALIGVVNASGTTPLPPDPALPWPADDFFAVISQNVVQGMVDARFASSPSTSFSGSGGGITFGNGISYSYAFGLQTPTVSFNLSNPPTVALACVLGGSVNCRVEVLWIPTNVPIAMGTSPSPLTLNMSLDRSGNTISFRSPGAPSFQITATPVGSFGANIIGDIIVEIINPLIARAAPIIGALLSAGVNGAISIPPASVTVESVTFSATPSFLSLSSFQTIDGMQGLVFGGDVRITVSQPVEALLALAS